MRILFLTTFILSLCTTVQAQFETAQVTLDGTSNCSSLAFSVEGIIDGYHSARVNITTYPQAFETTQDYKSDELQTNTLQSFPFTSSLTANSLVGLTFDIFTNEGQDSGRRFFLVYNCSTGTQIYNCEDRRLESEDVLSGCIVNARDLYPRLVVEEEVLRFDVVTQGNFNNDSYERLLLKNFGAAAGILSVDFTGAGAPYFGLGTPWTPLEDVPPVEARSYDSFYIRTLVPEESGVYEATAVITTNDPDQETIEVPLTLNFQSVPDLGVGSLSFPKETYSADSKTYRVRGLINVRNQGFKPSVKGARLNILINERGSGRTLARRNFLIRRVGVKKRRRYGFRFKLNNIQPDAELSIVAEVKGNKRRKGLYQGNDKTIRSRFIRFVDKL